jgi:transposase
LQGGIYVRAQCCVANGVAPVHQLLVLLQRHLLQPRWDFSERDRVPVKAAQRIVGKLVVLPVRSNISTAINWVRRLRERGSVAPGKMGGHKPRAISGEHRVWLLRRIEDGDFTLRGLVVELAERGLKVDYRSVWEFVHGEKLSFKKKRGGWRARSSRRRARRAQWIKYQDRIEPERLVFLDENWTKTNMTALRG